MLSGTGWDFGVVLCRHRSWTQWSSWVPFILKCSVILCLYEKYFLKIKGKFTFSGWYIQQAAHANTKAIRPSGGCWFENALIAMFLSAEPVPNLQYGSLNLNLEPIPLCGKIWQSSQMCLCPCLVSDFCTFQLEGLCCWLTLLADPWSWGFSVKLSQQTHEFRMQHKNKEVMVANLPV